MGPLAGYRIIEIAGIGPAPFAAMLLADMGAEVRPRRPPRGTDLGCRPRAASSTCCTRGRRSLALDLKSAARRRDRAAARATGRRADRRLPARRDGAARARPRRLPGAQPAARVRPHDRLGPGRPAGRTRAGHDINYIALAGALHAIGRAGEAPVPPLNLVGDFGGGGMFLAFGVLGALLEAQRPGKGQVVDAAMVDGAALLMALVLRHAAAGQLDATSAAPTCSTAARPSTTPTRPRTASTWPSARSSRSSTPSCIERLGLRREPAAPARPQRLAGCCAGASPRRSSSARATNGCAMLRGQRRLRRAGARPRRGAAAPAQRGARRPSSSVDGVMQPAPAPRFSRTTAEIGAPPRPRGADSEAILRDWGFAGDEIESWTSAGIVGTAKLTG